MKNILFIGLVSLFFSCSGNGNNTSTHDSNNAIEDHPLQDTSVDTMMNGYAPPHTDSTSKMADSTHHKP